MTPPDARPVHRESFTAQFWPTPLQRTLLEIALEDPERSRALWQEIQPTFSLDRMETGSFELMPLIYARLRESDADDPNLGRLKGIYRKSWYMSSLRMEQTMAVAEALEAAALPHVFVDGPFHGTRYYPEAPSRYSPEISLLVHETQLGRSIGRLARIGWRVRPGEESAFERRLFIEKGMSLLLQTRLSYDFGDDGPRANDLLLGNAELLETEQGAVRVLAPADTLLSVCTRGARKGTAANVQWLADAAMIVRSNEVDWDRLVESVGMTHQALRVRAGLDYLSSLPGPHAPPEVLKALADVPVSRRDRIQYQCASGSVGLLGAMPVILGDYLGATRTGSPTRAVVRFPAYLRDRWGLASIWLLPIAGVRRLAFSITRSARNALRRGSP